jgi:predicted transcriptional regulator
VNLFENLPSLEFHHKNNNFRGEKYKWEDLELLKSKEIVNILINQECVCPLIHSRFDEFGGEILKDYFNHEEINNYVKYVKHYIGKIRKNIENFEIESEEVIFRNPLTLKLPHTEEWKRHISKIYDFLKKNKKDAFGVYELVDFLNITPRHIYKHLKRFIDNEYVIKIKSKRGRFTFTDKGYKIIKEVKENYPDIL